ncbi:MAG: hypothetical protein AAB834_04595, partial [Patescibacteria group bacterium]
MPYPENTNGTGDEAMLLTREHQLSRRAFGRVCLQALGVAAVGLKTLSLAGDLASAMRYPPNDTRVELLPCTEAVPMGGEEWVNLSGLGQPDSRNAAYELAEAMDFSRPVAAIRYSNAGITPASIAGALAAYIRERQIKTLSIKGDSMGLVGAMAGLRYLNRQASIFTFRGTGVDLLHGQPMPAVGRVVANSSPFNMEDAFRGEFAHLLAESGYKGDLVGKFLYSLFDGSGDGWHLLPPNDKRKIMKHIVRSLRQTFDHCSAELFMSQLVILDDADLEDDWQDLRTLFTETAATAYCKPDNAD